MATTLARVRRLPSATAADCKGDYFIPISQLQQNLQADHPQRTQVPSLCSGAAGTAISTAASYPLALIATRLQIQRDLQEERRKWRKAHQQEAEQRCEGHSQPQAQSPHRVRFSVPQQEEAAELEEAPEYDGVVDAARKIYSQEGGLRALYAGFQEACGQAVADTVLFVLAYNAMKSRRTSRITSSSRRSTAVATAEKHELSVTDDLIIGAAAECLAKLITTPISVILSYRQIESFPGIKTSESVLSAASAKAVAKRVIDKNGIKGLWSGYGASCLLSLTQGLAAAITTGLEKAQRSSVTAGGSVQTTTYTPTNITVTRPRHPNRRHDRTTMFADGMGKVIAACLMYPFNVAKVRAQISCCRGSGTNLGITPRSSIQSVIRTASTKGIMALYAGLSGELVRGLITHGLGVVASAMVRAFLLWAYWRILQTKEYTMRYFISRRPRPSFRASLTSFSDSLENHLPPSSEMTYSLSLSSTFKSLINHAKIASNNLTRQVPRLAQSAVTALGLGGMTKAPKDLLNDSMFVPTPVPPCNIPGHHHMCDCMNEELAELVHDYVDDDDADWRSLYQDHWLLKL
ncbi:hypothetical protein KEM54_004351 [Ascosphaera aggregata]|nr:hypothetical protein KEM54_004351 [Ascosphaera aggregata]